MRRIYARHQAREERGRLLSAARGAEVGEQERHDGSKNSFSMIQCVVSYIMEARRWLRSQQIGYASERFGRASERFSEQGSLYPGSPGQRTVSVGEEAASESR